MTSKNRIRTYGLNDFPVASRYRVVLLGSSGEVYGMARLDVDNDSSAIVEAESLMNGHAIELWDGARFVKYFSTIDLSNNQTVMPL